MMEEIPVNKMSVNKLNHTVGLIRYLSDFDEYVKKNPRESIPKHLEKFLEYAQKKYSKLDAVNWEYPEDEEDKKEVVKSYIGDCAEALLLFKAYLENQKLERKQKNSDKSLKPIREEDLW